MSERVDRVRWALDRRRVFGRLLGRQAEAAGFELMAESRVRVSRGAPGTRLVLGDQVYLHRDVGFYLDAPGALVEVGDRTFVNRRTEIVAQERVTIGADCLLGWDVWIADTDYHRVDGASPVSPVTVGDRVWIGSGARVLKGVTIGEGAVVAAGALVTRDVPERALVSGLPARVVREGVTWS